jgi:hypothetical protein
MLLVEPEPPFDLDADPLDVARAGEDLRADGRDFEEEDFEDEAFDDDAFEEERDFEEARDFDGRDFDGRDFEEDFFDDARDAEDFRPVFFARPELFDLPAALPAAFFFFMATGSPPLPGLAGARIIQFQVCRIEKTTAF